MQLMVLEQLNKKKSSDGEAGGGYRTVSHWRFSFVVLLEQEALMEKTFDYIR